jgi:hypothetical protein
VAAHAEARVARAAPFEPSPAPDTRVAAIRSHHPAGCQDSLVGGDAHRAEGRGSHTPLEPSTQLLGAPSETCVEERAAHAFAGPVREPPFGDQLSVEIADADERSAPVLGEPHTEGLQLPRATRHEPLAAGLVEGWPVGVHHHDAQPPLACPDGGGQARRTGSDDHDVGCFGEV